MSFGMLFSGSATVVAWVNWKKSSLYCDAPACVVLRKGPKE